MSRGRWAVVDGPADMGGWVGRWGGGRRGAAVDWCRLMGMAVRGMAVRLRVGGVGGRTGYSIVGGTLLVGPRGGRWAAGSVGGPR